MCLQEINRFKYTQALPLEGCAGTMAREAKPVADRPLSSCETLSARSSAISVSAAIFPAKGEAFLPGNIVSIVGGW